MGRGRGRRKGKKIEGTEKMRRWRGLGWDV